MNASLGCGVPTAVADLREGEVVLDLADPNMEEHPMADMQAWTGCIAGALTERHLGLARREVTDAPKRREI